VISGYWRFSEAFGVNLRRFTPRVFGQAIALSGTLRVASSKNLNEMGIVASSKNLNEIL
jgi:hypothetical protein